MTSGTPRRRIHISRLELDLRGISPSTAEVAARALGGALSRELGGPLSRKLATPPAARIDAGRITSAAAPDAHQLAAGIARQIARSVGGKGE